MSDRSRFGARLRVLRIRRADRDLEEELAFHFTETVEALMAGGMARQEAEAEARRRFGDPRHRERLAAIDRAAARRRRWRMRIGGIGDAARFAVRGITRSPGLSLGIVLIFALGLGANATMYGTMDRLLLRPPDHIRDPGDVRRLWVDRMSLLTKERSFTPEFTYPDYVELRRTASFSAVVAYADRTLVVGHGEAAKKVAAQLVTGDYWDALGVRPALGRFFDASEDVRDGAAVAVISYGAWQREYGGDRSVLGRDIDFGRGPYTIIGVTPSGFTGAELSSVDLWVPLHVAAYQLLGDYWAESRGWWWLSVVARLGDGVIAERAAAEATAIYRGSRHEEIEAGYEAPDPRLIPASLIAARGPEPGAEASVARWLAGVSLIVLLIACANVANLLVARSIRGQRETAIRLALGITRQRLIVQLLAEGVLLAVLGAATSLLVTYWGGGFMQRSLLPDVAWGSPLSGGVVSFVLVTAVAAGLFSTLLPAIQASRYEVAGALHATSGGITTSSSRLRGWLSGLQAALSVVLLVGAGLFVRSLHRVENVDLGFDARHLVYMRPTLASGSMPDAERPIFFEQVRERVSRLPDVRGVASAEIVPFRGGIIPSTRPEGMDSMPRSPGGRPYIDKVSPEYFSVMGIDIRRGRAFEDSDRKGAPPVTVISESMARHIWPNDEAIGRCLFIGRDSTECVRIIGVVEDARRSRVTEPARMIFYVPIAQELAPEVRGTWTLLARTRDDARQLVDAVRRITLETDPRVRFAETQALQDLIDPQLRSWTLGATLFTVFGVLALVVAAVGLYSVLSFDVAQRTREIGLRSALGATPASVVRLFIRRALWLTAAGTVAGVIAAILLAPRIEHLLFETAPRDPTTFAAVALMLTAVAIAAAALPAWRAARVDPNVALRAD
ncbi:MAG: ADOP family duplicated permease [Longimicrobiales bacterium]